MNIDKEKLREAGFNDNEIAWIEHYCSAKVKNGEFSNQAALVCLGTPENPDICWVCLTVAEAINNLRPGAWLK